MEPEVMTLTEAAQFLRLSPEGLRRHAFAGTIPGWQIGTAWRFSRTALMARLGWRQEVGDGATLRSGNGLAAAERPVVGAVAMAGHPCNETVASG